jgi:hypothetical protein
MAFHGPRRALCVRVPAARRHRLMIFPDRNASFVVWSRRHLPRIVWWNVHRIEGF